MKGKGNIKVMGIVNLTDDSYFAESRCADVAAVLARVEQMVAEGADIVDFGACSTRPGSFPVGEEEEWKRLKAVLPIVRKRFPDLRISVDTYWSSVVRGVHELIGDFIVNDISAGEDDSMMLKTVGELGLTYVAMHKRGTPADMQSFAYYDDVTEEVVAYFQEFAARAEDAGVKDWIVDPGFGFSKTLEQNWELLGNLSRFASLRRGDGVRPPLLVGISRKSMIYKFLGISPEESLPATQAAHLAALFSGADILRVHDVVEAVQTVKIFNSLIHSAFCENLL